VRYQGYCALVIMTLTALAACRTRPPADPAPPASPAGNRVVEDPRSGKGVFTPLYLDGYAPPPYGLKNGRATFKAPVVSSAFLRSGVAGDDLLTAPASGRKCVFWWLEVFYQEGDVRHDVFAGDAGVPVLVDVGDRLVQADATFCRHGAAADFERTFAGGEEPDTGGLVPVHLFPRTTWREWILVEGRPYAIAVEKRAETNAACYFTFGP